MPRPAERPASQRDVKHRERMTQRKELRAKTFDELSAANKDELLKTVLLKANLIAPDPEPED